MPLKLKVAEQVMTMMMESERVHEGESVLVAVGRSKIWNCHASLGALVDPPMNHHKNSSHYESWRQFRLRSIQFFRQP
jgi:hypothetical protein